jgi:hypothetical protein
MFMGETHPRMYLQFNRSKHEVKKRERSLAERITLSPTERTSSVCTAIFSAEEGFATILGVVQFLANHDQKKYFQRP